MNESYRRLGSILQVDPEWRKLREMVSSQEVVDKFFEICPQFIGHVVPIKMQKQVLTLAVENAVLRSEIKFHEQELIQKINEFFNDQRIDKIKFQA
ncbi:MAG: DUF721 domain-containing protein [Ignavibacteria bacterium]|nr:DUF721 domain-containing protein [Ignavibacteria bacterium]